MSKKQNMSKKGKTTEIALSREEADELQMIVDRLAVQSPDGESFQRYLQSLRNTLADRQLLAAALIDRLSRNPNETGFLTFLAFENAIEASPFRRHIKQAAYRFVQKGFSAPKDAQAPEKVVLIQGEARKASAHFFLVQGTLWLISALIPETVHPGYALITAFLEDDYATFNARTAESTPKMYRDYLLKISEHTLSRKAVDIPLWHAAALFFEMLDIWVGKETYAELERARDILAKYREPARKPYAYGLLPEIDNPGHRLTEVDIDKLLEGMDLSWLRFGKEELAPCKEKLTSLGSPLLVVPPEVQHERTLDQLRSTANDLCSEKRRLLYRRFFEEQAMALKLSGNDEKADWAWIVAQHLASGAPAGENPAVFEILMYSLDYFWPNEFNNSRQQQQAPEQERRTESGIILP